MTVIEFNEKWEFPIVDNSSKAKAETYKKSVLFDLWSCPKNISKVSENHNDSFCNNKDTPDNSRKWDTLYIF